VITCIGDSFTAGAELPGYSCLGKDDVVSEFAWPAVLQELTDHAVTNLGRGGVGNTRIIKRAIDVTLAKSADIIVIAWSDHHRAEIIDENGIFCYWPGRNIDLVIDSKRKDIIKGITVAVTDNFYKWHHRKWLREVLLLQSFFKSHNQKYIMVQGHGSQHYNRMWVEESQLHNDLAQHVDVQYFLGWPSDGFYEFTQGAEVCPGGHPGILGHRRIAERINEHIRNLGWIS
jgi:hypothetical protein